MTAEDTRERPARAWKSPSHKRLAFALYGMGAPVTLVRLARSLALNLDDVSWMMFNLTRCGIAKQTIEPFRDPLEAGACPHVRLKMLGEFTWRCERCGGKGLVKYRVPNGFQL